MSQVQTVAEEPRGWWERLFHSLLPRPEDAMNYQLPPDSLFADTWNQGASAVADVPEQVKAQIREEAVLSIVNRLEASLRLLLYATTPGKEPPTADHCRQILNVWRYELEHRIHLTPDTYCGAVQRYEPELDEAYSIIGRCQPGDLIRIRVPCWRMYEKVVIRGEAELVESVEQLDLPLEALREMSAPPEVEEAPFRPSVERSAVVTVTPCPAPTADFGDVEETPVATTAPANSPQAADPYTPEDVIPSNVETTAQVSGPAELGDGEVTLTPTDQEVFAALSTIPPTDPDGAGDAVDIPPLDR